MRSRYLMIVALILLPLRFSAEEPRISRAVYNVFSEDEEVVVGKSAAREVEERMPVLHDKILETYLNRVGQMVARDSRRPKLQYHFGIVDSAAVNAFALPGGYIYVNRGLLDFVENESELAAVLAHEIGHLAGYHPINEFSKELILERIVEQGRKAGILKESNADSMLQRAGGAVLAFVERKFTRQQEAEADLLGLYNMVRSGWKPSGMVSMLSRLQDFKGNPGLIEKLLSTHPLPMDRIRSVSDEIAHVPASSSGKLTESSLLFTAAKARLRMLPAPSAQERP